MELATDRGRGAPLISTGFEVVECVKRLSEPWITERLRFRDKAIQLEDANVGATRCLGERERIIEKTGSGHRRPGKSAVTHGYN